MKFNKQSRPLTQWIKIAKARHFKFSCDYSRLIFAKENEFYLVNEAYVSLLVEGGDGWGLNGSGTTCDGL